MHQGRFEEAEALHRQSLQQVQKLGNRQDEIACLWALSYTLSFAGKFFAAQETAGRVLELDRELGHYPNPTTLNSFIKATIHLGQYAEALTLATESLETARQRGLLRETSWALLWLGEIALVEGDLGGAKRILQESLAGLEEMKHIYQALLLAMLSYVVRAQGDGQSACDYLIEALHSGIEYRSISPIMYCLPVAALLAADAGHTERAIELYSLAQRFGHITNSLWFEAIACRELEGVLASVPPEAAAAAAARGRELDLWATVEALLRDLANR
jgi:tetratricopeptide (TPR) repeat protein